MAGRDVPKVPGVEASSATKMKDPRMRVTASAGLVDPEVSVPLAEVVSALSIALDISEGQPEGHAGRTCLVGMRIAEVIGLDSPQRSALFYALLLKDLGGSSNAARLTSLFETDDLAAKRDLRITDWTRRWPTFRYILRNAAPQARAFDRWRRIADVTVRTGRDGIRELFGTRAMRGSEIARAIGFADETVGAIRSIDEHWDGSGQPDGMAHIGIPLLARIAGLAQNVAVSFDADGVSWAHQVAGEFSGRWFDPELVKALASIQGDAHFWATLSRDDLRDEILAIEPSSQVIWTTDEWLDRSALGFAQVVDAKSPWSARHSENVAELSVLIGQQLGLVKSELRDLNRAALLHDIGKLGLSNRIWDKPSFLTDEERAEIERHPTITRRILARAGGYRGIAELAGAHHERLDGRGYDRGLRAAELSTSVRILTISNFFDALSAKRPYREGLALNEVMRTIRGDVYLGICPRAFEGLVAAIDSGWIRAEP